MGGSQSTAKYNGPVDVVKKLYKEGGIKSIYRGTAATLLRGLSFTKYLIYTVHSLFLLF